ncbi:aldose epimerase family protein [uncultured Roseobacter sp.]|uniref:aldose epimerase family protein n=1 Tax=uncultured Roseobacter sp. TaxID=114847 RepID=UPI002603BD50|nr:aldose epimerase family protein [uncultured Roseobacter sp.]
MKMEAIGEVSGQTIEAVTLRGGETEARLITYGARLTHLWVPDATGRLGDIVLGHDELAPYTQYGTYFGATCGQYANRIAGGKCLLDGQLHQLDLNEGPNHLHGGTAGFDRKVWRVAALDDHSVTFATETGDGEMGYPGPCTLQTRYALDESGALDIEMTATTAKPTIMNMVNHAYFNLAGAGDVLGHHLQIPAAFYTPVDEALLATGEIADVEGMAFDFRQSKTIGQDIGTLSSGYDHNLCLGPTMDGMRLCAVATDPVSGRRLRLLTSEPGVQLYTGGALSADIPGKQGQSLCRFAGFTLETQKFPGSPQFAHFPSAMLNPGEHYRHRMRFTFDALSPS